MSALFAKIVKQALLTFDQKNILAFPNNFQMLKQLTDQLTIRDLNLNPELLSENIFNKADKAPCTYVHVFQTKDVSMSVFILRADYTMPLHDHPMMHGILKGLTGTLLIRSYTKTSPNELCVSSSAKEVNVMSEPPNIVTNSTECAILTPNERNYHEITALNGIAAFFDILGPPYDSDIPIYGQRKCNFYRRVLKEENNEESILLKIPTPLTYYCDTGEYSVPDFLFELNCHEEV